MTSEADGTDGSGPGGSRAPGRAATPAAQSAGALDTALAGALAGDDADFAEIYRAVHPPLLRYLRVLVRDEAEDVAAETWAQVVRDLDRFTGDLAGFRAWIATIGRHRALDHLRARSRRPVDPAPDAVFGDRAARSDTAAEAVEAVSTREAIALITTLPRDQAEAVLLRAVMGLDAKAAGRVLGKRPGAVRTASHRGLRTLAERLGDGGAR